jgi:hypothetical protein
MQWYAMLSRFQLELRHSAAELMRRTRTKLQARPELQAVFNSGFDLSAPDNLPEANRDARTATSGPGSTAAKGRAPLTIGLAPRDCTLAAVNAGGSARQQGGASKGLMPERFTTRWHFLEGLNCPSAQRTAAKSPRVPSARALGERAENKQPA